MMTGNNAMIVSSAVDSPSVAVFDASLVHNGCDTVYLTSSDG